MKERWYKIDNAGKIFPTTFSKSSPNSFRFSVTLKDEVDESLLLPALNSALERFPIFKVRLKRGFFWYYFEPNNKKPLITKEPANIYSEIHPFKNNGYLFNLHYFERRISLDVFHAITDGNGALEFFKCIVYNYLELIGVKIVNRGEVMTNDYEISYDEKEDSFLKNYDNRVKKTDKEPSGYRILGTRYDDNYTALIQASMNIDELKTVSKKYGVTVTQYISSAYIYAVYLNEYHKINSSIPVTLNVPVNVRKYMQTNSLRNFALFIRVFNYFNENTSFLDIVECVKETFSTELTIEKIRARIVQNVSLEKNFLIRIMPLFLKKIAMKIGYKILGSRIDSLVYSNIGVVKMPEATNDYIEHFDFVICATPNTPITISSLTFNDEFILSITSVIKERKIVESLIHQFVKDGINVTINCNDLEVGE